ncbi:carbon-nitrogen hydrolase family protein [Streptomyces sp. UNOC14_S4]|uniref:carbon-nitrogen hydrolase family protein n=1 Tax=Streptomyces sp. UNOC14_S4 TaxID=2872340 RepID=UPI0027E36BDC|nr:carbon-nitrogen hydrolase family protein [Streptomyces sp. UNOC14_S4]
MTETEAAKGFVRGSGDGRFTLDGVGVGLVTCFDAHFPDLAARAAADGCRVLVASSLYGEEGGREARATLFPILARDNGLYVLLANHAGQSGPYNGCGLSGIWGPGGEVLAVSEGTESALVPAELAVRAA